MNERGKNKMITISVILLLILIGVLILTLAKDITAVEEIQGTYSFTKAICNERNFCQDYEIVCENWTIKRISPITGAFVQHEKSW